MGSTHRTKPQTRPLFAWTSNDGCVHSLLFTSRLQFDTDSKGFDLIASVSWVGLWGTKHRLTSGLMKVSPSIHQVNFNICVELLFIAYFNLLLVIFHLVPVDCAVTVI